MARLGARSVAGWLTAGIGVAMVAGCAPLPKDIKPAAVSAVPYEAWSCTRLTEEQQRLATALSAASAKENEVRGKDTAAVILFGMPLQSWLGGNEAKEIASLKGQQAAVAEAQKDDACAAGASSTETQS